VAHAWAEWLLEEGRVALTPPAAAGLPCRAETDEPQRRERTRTRPVRDHATTFAPTVPLL
jgi:hypothetical protein